MKDFSRTIMGLLFIGVGVLFLLNVMGVLSFSIWSGFATYWPVLVILLGVAMIFRKGWMALALVFIFIILAGLIFAPVTRTVSQKQFTEKVQLLPGVSDVDLNVNFGAGNLNIGKGTPDYYVTSSMKDYNAPKITVDQNGKTASITMERNELEWNGRNVQAGTWDLGLTPDMPMNLDINYGASDAKFDFRGLSIDNLNVKTGASSTLITFPAYPTKAMIDTGASSLDMRFPSVMPVLIVFHGGLASGDFNGFTKDANNYYTSNYQADKPHIEVDVQAGASSVTGKLI